jgi:Na+-transporting methylmalonyl-CoA/oxaloacetate decarboxylase gamma subunit
MNVGLLIAGIVLMILGVSAYVYVQSTLHDCASFMGQLGNSFQVK